MRFSEIADADNVLAHRTERSDIDEIHKYDQFKKRIICFFPAIVFQPPDTTIFYIQEDILLQKTKGQSSGTVRLCKREIAEFVYISLFQNVPVFRRNLNRY